jgi:hypothetical protein
MVTRREEIGLRLRRSGTSEMRLETVTIVRTEKGVDSERSMEYGERDGEG